MVKLTLVGRLSDGLPLAQTPTYMNEDDEVFLSFYRQQGELVLKKISRGALGNPRMSILIDHHCFHYLVGNGACYITLCESSYPRKLAFYYLEDLQKELEKLDIKLLESLSNPYSLKRFDYVIGNIKKRYLDTRTQANLSKLNSNRQQDLGIPTKEFSEVVIDSRALGSEVETTTDLTEKESRIWNSQLLEVIALKWTPITLIMFAAVLLFWASTSSNGYD